MGEVKRVPGGVNTTSVAEKACLVKCVLEDQHGQQAVHVSVARSGDATVVQT